MSCKLVLCETRLPDDVIHWGITDKGLQLSEQAMRAIKQHFSLNATKFIQSPQISFSFPY